MLTTDVIMETSSWKTLSKFCNYRRHKEQYNVTQCNYKGPLSLFENKALGLEMHFIGFQATYYHADAT